MIACVTGATGFIGSHLADSLLAQGYTVRTLVRKTSNRRWIQGKNIECIEGDVRDPASLHTFLAGADYIFHIAGVVKARAPEEYFLGNDTATRHMLEAARDHAPALRRFLFVSSQTAAGPAPSADRPLTEDMPANPITTYGRSKIAAETTVQSFTGIVPWTIVRPPAVFGPRDTEIFIYFQTIAKGLNSLIGFGEKRLNLISTEDLVRGIILAATAEVSLHQTYYLASTQAYTWPEVGRISAKLLAKRTVTVRLPHGLVYSVAAVAQLAAALQRKPATLNLEKARDITRQYWLCDSSKALRDLGWRDEVPLEEAIRRTIAWYREQGWL
ncbi:MAG: NAD-dependent epimerase/dehydratase family protein [Ignavibacteria bacterium]|nr:NAD-dependent epimerase/dehydratase family protein [Ignavibacteria bacterium]